MEFGDITSCIITLLVALLLGIPMSLWRGKGFHYQSLTLKTFSNKQIKKLEKKWYWFLYKGQAKGKNNSITIFGFWFQTISLIYLILLFITNIVLIILAQTKIATIVTIATIIPYLIFSMATGFILERKSNKNL